MFIIICVGDYLSSYKGHSIFALILSLMFFLNPLAIALTVIGANIPDFDHKFKKDNVYQMIILGLVVFIFLYVLNLPFYIGLIIIFLGITFYFSKHRSFTHALFGVLTLASSVALMLIWAFELCLSITTLNNPYLIMSILIVLLGFLFLNKNILMIFMPLFFISLFIMPHNILNYLTIFLALLLGVFSHILLDSFTPAGVKIFAPLSSKKVFKKFGYVSIALLVMLSVLYRLPLIISIFNLQA